MDSKKLSYSRIAEPKLLDPLKKEIKEVLDLLGLTEKQLKTIISEFADMSKKTPLDSMKNLDKVVKGLDDAKKATEDLDKVEKDRLKLEAQLKDLEDSRVQANFNLKEEIRLQTKQLRDSAKATKAQSDAYEKLKNDTNKAQLEAKKLTVQFGANSKVAKEARKRFYELDDQLSDVNKKMRDGRRDVGRYTEGTKKLTAAFKGFASATIVLKILELLKGSIAENSDGAADLQKIWVNVTATFQVVAQRLTIAFPIIQAKFEQLILSFQIGFAELKNLFGGNSDEVDKLKKEYDALSKTASKDVSSAFAGMGKEIQGLIKAKQKLIDDTLKYRRANIELEKGVNDLIPSLEKLRAEFEDDSKSMVEQINAGLAFQKELKQRQELERQVAKNNLDVAQQKADANKTSVEAQEELIQAAREYYTLVAEQDAEMVSTSKEIQKLRDDITQQNLDYYIDDYDNRKTVNERIIADETQTYKRRKELLAENLKNAQASFDGQEEALNDSLKQRGKELIDFEALRKKTSSEEIANIIKNSGLSDALQTRALEVIRERRTVLQDNAEATRDLNAAEAESNKLLDDSALQREALNKLQKKGVDLEKVLYDLSKARLKSEIENIRERLSKAEEGSAEYIRLNNELNQKLLEQDQNTANERKAVINDLVNSSQAAFQLLGTISQKYNQARMNQIQREIQAEQNRANSLQELAAQGNEDAKNNLALVQQNQAKLELQRQQQIQREKKAELALTAIQTYGAKIQAGSKAPLASTISDISVLQAFINSLPGFYEGTENTGTKGVIRDEHGVITGFTHENEKVLNAKHTQMVGEMSNAELAELAYRERTKPKQSDIANKALIAEIQDLKKITRDRPVYLGSDYDAVNELVTATVKKGSTTERISRRKGGVW